MEPEDTNSTIYNDKNVTKPKSQPRMTKKMKSIVMYIHDQLGGQVLDLELSPAQIKDVVNQAFEEIKHYITDIYTVTVPYSQCIDVSKYNIDAVESVIRGQDSVLTGIPFQIPAMQLMNVTGMYDLEEYANAMLVKRNLNILSTDMDFQYDKPNRKLYVNANPNPPKQVTIRFKPEYFDVEDIKEQYWITQLRKLSLAMCKTIIGRIRSKYTASSAKYQLDGRDILAEGNQEQQAIRAELDKNKDIFTVLN